ncbi:MAG: hypothetical protein ABI233_03300 [Chthoniobacterales bacterium]
MKNSNGDNFPKEDPMAETEFGQEISGRTDTSGRIEEGARNFSNAASDTWDQTRQKAVVVRERTEFFLRENPIPTVLGALALGLAIGLAIRYASRPVEPQPLTVRNALKNIDWSGISEPAKPFLRKMRRGYDESAEAVTDAVKEGIDRVREVDVDRYVKPLRKQWRSWLS